jgi:hypothetical protein
MKITMVENNKIRMDGKRYEYGYYFTAILKTVQISEHWDIGEINCFSG